MKESTVISIFLSTVGEKLLLRKEHSFIVGCTCDEAAVLRGVNVWFLVLCNPLMEPPSETVRIFPPRLQMHGDQ